MHKSTFLLSIQPEILPKLSDINLDSVFIGYDNATRKNIELVRKIKFSDFEIYTEIAVFSGEKLLEKYPEAKPVEASGKTVNKDGYVGLCPTHEGVRKEALDKVKTATTRDVNGIWLNFIRYPMNWEVANPEVVDTCYCPRCIKKFEEFIGEPIDGVGGEGSELENLALHIDGSYYHEWLEFKTNQIASLVGEVRRIIDDSGKNIKLGFFAVPWQDKDYGAGIKRVLGQDFEKLSGLVDIFSPMLYHKMVGKNPKWISEMVDYFWQVGKPFFPLVQTENKPSNLSTKEFEEALVAATKKPSLGVCVFFFDDLVKNPTKFDVVKKFFN